MASEAPRLPRPTILLFALALLAILPFAASLGGWFIYDDFKLVIHNDGVREFRLKELWTEEFFPTAQGPQLHYFRPLVSTTLAIDWAIFGGNASGFHATNLILHAIVTALIYRTLARWSGREAVALIGALVWAWHPSKVEAVAWIAGRTDILCTLGLLVAAAGASRRFRGLRHGLTLELLGAFVAFSSKENAVVLPALIAVEAWVAKGRPSLDFGTVRAAVVRSLPHATLSAAYVAARLLTVSLGSTEASAANRFSVALILETCGEIVRILALPWPLALHRAPIEVDTTGQIIHDPVRLGLGALAIVGLVAGVAFAWRRQPLVTVGILLSAVLCLPTANVWPLGQPVLFSERFLYLPTLGVAVIIVALAPSVWNRSAKVLTSATALAMTAYAGLSLAHTDHFEDEQRFWRHEFSVQPEVSVTIEPIFNQAFREGRYEEALDLAIRGYRNGHRWLFGRNVNIGFTLLAAKAKEAMTPAHDAAALTELANFYRHFFLEKTAASFAAGPQTFLIDGRWPSAQWLREDNPGGFGEAQANGAHTLARAADCVGALALAREARDLITNLSGLRTTALAFARCGAFDDAYELTSRLGDHSVARPEIEAELAALRTEAEARGN